MQEKNKNTTIFIIMIIILILLCLSLMYHSGYIKLTQDIEQNEDTIVTDGEVVEDKTSTDNQTSSNSINTINGPYSIVERNNSISKEEDINIINALKFMQGSNEFQTLSNLDIFKNFEYDESKLIYPGLSGTYDFKVENDSDKEIMYKISVIEDNPRNVNMKYKLKRNGEFIAGNDNEYVTITELQKPNLAVDSKKGDTYRIYWKWIDTDKDALSSSPIERGEYKLTIKGEV